MVSKAIMTGNWNALTRRVNSFKRMNTEEFEIIIEKIGEHILKVVQDNIRSSLYSDQLPPLAESTLRKKDEDGQMFIKTGEWVENLKVKKVTMGKRNFNVFIGGFEEDIHVVVDEEGNESSITMKQLSEWIEYGNAKQPPRPIFHLTWTQLRPEVVQLVNKLIGEEIYGGARGFFRF